MELNEPVVVVTGAGGAIGAAIALRLAGMGARLVLADRDEGLLDRTVESIRNSSGITGGEPVLRAVLGDVTDPGHHVELVDQAGDLGGVDLMVLASGVYLPGLVWETPIEHWRLQMDVNFWGVLYGIRAAVPGMIERGRGHVVAVSSGAGLVATPALGPYVASKHAVVGLMESLHHELRRVAPGVGVSVACPGNVRSDMAGNSLRAAGIEHESIKGVPAAVAEVVRAGVAAGDDPSVVADSVLRAVTEQRFWVLPQPEIGWVAVDRMERLRDGRDPVDLID